MYQLVRIGSAMPTLHYRTKPIACSGVRVAGNLLGTTLSFRTPFLFVSVQLMRGRDFRPQP
jgi:hypothetical protein